MTPAEAFSVCESTVRRVDPDRYFSTLFAPADKRPRLHALYAFNHEVARASEAGRDPAIADIRLQWWRDAIVESQDRVSRSHPAIVAVAEILSCRILSPADFENLVDARAREVSSLPFPDLASMESQAQATSSAVMKMAAQILDEACDAVELTREAGIAYGLTGLLRSVPFHAGRGKLFLPEDLMAAEGVTSGDVLADKCASALRRVGDKVRACARQHFARAKEKHVPREILPAVLPAALVPAYHARLIGSDPLHAGTDITQLHRQFILLRAVLQKRL